MDTDFSRLAAILGKREVFMAHTPMQNCAGLGGRYWPKSSQPFALKIIN
jgi:hypothetical protein